MNTPFTYSILQYKHSLLTREALNVGILFAFSNESVLEFVVGNSYRVKSIYLDFDVSVFNASLSFIHEKIRKETSITLFNQEGIKENFKQFINNRLLREDATTLQFTDPISAVSITDNETTKKNYTKLLLSGIDTKKPETVRHNEAYIVREYTRYLFEHDRNAIEKKVSRDFYVHDNNVNLKFDLCWKNGTTNLVKALSFDLKEQQDIQNKSAQYFGYFTLLSKYAETNKSRFDILVARPQDRKLWKEYDKAIDTISKAQAQKRIILPNQLKLYSEETRDYLSKTPLN